MTERIRDRVARRMAWTAFERIEDERLVVVERDRTRTFGPAGAELEARLEVRDPRLWTALLRGTNGAAHAYMDDWWDSPDLVALVRVAARNLGPLDRLRRRVHPVWGPVQRLARMVPRNTRRGARKHIAAHYDLGNELFSTFLDERLMYSCAWFEQPDMTLEEAQLAKLDRICRQLELDAGDHLLEIGTGWGGLAIHAAGQYGCRVTTTTISREQRELATQRAADAGLSDRIEILDRDYRDLEGEFDKLVSIEMIEAVGWQYFPRFFEVCSERLRPDGLMFLQAIVIDDDLYEYEKASPSFANTLIFPGGCLPSERVIRELVASRTDMRPSWSDDITDSYVRTLASWRERFNAAVSKLEPLGYDRRFQRLWNLYLTFSEGGFRERRIRDVQFVFAKPEARPGAAAAASSQPAMA
jgi:cyclopropane-fatty-acyl-phospholipid synthase